MCHKLFSLLALLEVNDIDGLDLVAHIVAKRVALKGDHSGDLNRCQLLTKGRHARAPVHYAIDMGGDWTCSDFTAGNSGEDRDAFAVYPMTCGAVSVVHRLTLFVELL